MANTNMSKLHPKFWAVSFDMLDVGIYNFQKFVSRKYENIISKAGVTVDVPLTPDLGEAEEYVMGTVTPTTIDQENVLVTLNKPRRKTIALTDSELSLAPYKLLETYGVPLANAILRSVNTEIYKEILKAKYFEVVSAPDEDDVVDMKTALSNRFIGAENRNLIMAPDELGTLLKLDAFQHANVSGDGGTAMTEGQLRRKFGFNFHENNTIETYTPADVTGAVNAVGNYAEGVTTMIVNGFDDDANPVRPGDIFKIAAEAGAPYHTVISTTTTTSDTTGITFYPGIAAGGVLHTAVITVTPSKSAIALVPAGCALAARPFAGIPEGLGVKTAIIYYQEIPIRISIWAANLVVYIQYDILFGVKKVLDERIQRLAII